MQSVNLTNHYLIAMPSMVDSYFAKSLTFVCEHNEQGALGIVINRPIDMTLQTLFDQIEIPSTDAALGKLAIHFGGPVQMDRGFVLHEPLGDWESTLAVTEDVGLTTSKDILEALAQGRGPTKFLVSRGYAGWAPGQLEHELSQNGWLSVPASSSALIFEIPAEDRFHAAMQLLGIDPAMLSDEAGHA